MAPKRLAQPPPPAGSDEETTSGSGSEDTEEEEEIAHSPPSAAPKNTAPPPQKVQESESSEEDEDDDEEDEDGDEEEEEEKANEVNPPPATKKQSPPLTNPEESETSDEEEDEEGDEEMPPPKPAPNQVAEGKGAKPPPPPVEEKRPSAPFQRTWSTDDEVRILEALAAHRVEHGTLPQPDALAAALAGSLDNSGCSAADLQRKVKSLRSRYSAAAKKGELPSKDHDRRLLELSKKAWGTLAVATAANGGARRDVAEMCELYPYLAEVVKALDKEHPGLFKREFAMIGEDKARSLDAKLKQQRLAQMKLHQRHHDLTKEVTKTLIDLAERWLGPS